MLVSILYMINYTTLLVLWGLAEVIRFVVEKGFPLKFVPGYEFYLVLIPCLHFPESDINTYNAAGVSRRQDQNVTNFVKNVNILEFDYYI